MGMVLETAESRKKWLDDVRELFKRVDEDGTGEVDQEEFELACNDVRAQAIFGRLGLDIDRECVGGLFELLDFDSNGVVDLDEFSLAIQMLHGNAKSIDLAKLRHENKVLCRQIIDIKDVMVSAFKYQAKMMGVADTDADLQAIFGEKQDKSRASIAHEGNVASLAGIKKPNAASDAGLRKSDA